MMCKQLRLDRDMDFRGVRLSCEEESATLFAPFFEGRASEHLIVAHLDAAHRLVAISEAESRYASAIVMPMRTILTDALAHDGRAMVLAHNHPSGDPTPSHADIEATQALHAIVNPLGIRLYDHLVLTSSGKRTSFRRLGWL